MPAQGAEVTLITELATTDITTDDLGRIDFKGVEYGRIRLQVRTAGGPSISNGSRSDEENPPDAK